MLLLSSCTSGNRQESNVDTVSIVAEESIVEDIFPEWEIRNYVDEFGENTSDQFARMTMEGEFSNSATTNSSLTIRLIVDKDDIRFDMYEYGSHYMKGEGTLNFKAKLPNDSIIEFRTFNSDSGINSVTSSDVDKVKELLLTYPKIRFSAKTTGSYGSPSTYRFTYTGDANSLKTILSKI